MGFWNVCRKNATAVDGTILPSKSRNARARARQQACLRPYLTSPSRSKPTKKNCIN